MGKIANTIENEDYYRTLWCNPQLVIDKCLQALLIEGEKAHFDTIVCCGTSGITVGLRMADQLNCNLFIARKESEHTHHNGLGAGIIGDRWLFVDDFFATGNTFRRAHRCARIVNPEAILIGGLFWWTDVSEVNEECSRYEPKFYDLNFMISRFFGEHRGET